MEVQLYQRWRHRRLLGPWEDHLRWGPGLLAQVPWWPGGGI